MKHPLMSRIALIICVSFAVLLAAVSLAWFLGPSSAPSGGPSGGVTNYPAAAPPVDATATVPGASAEKASTPANLPEGTEVLPESPKAVAPKAFLTIVSVSKAAGLPFDGRGWEGTLAIKGTDDVKIVEIVMWDNGSPDNPDLLSVYLFDRSFDPHQPQFDDGGKAWVNYREKYNIANINVPHGCSSATGEAYFVCSSAYLKAFEEAFSKVTLDAPADNYALKYIGHGSTKTLFEGRLSEADSQELLAGLVRTTGKKLAFLDWGYNCSMGSVDVVESQYQYADYIRASDIPRQGFAADWAKDYAAIAPEGDMARFFNRATPIRTSLVEMNQAERAFWETKTVRDDMTAKRLKQSLSVYDTGAFPALATAVDLDDIEAGADVLGFIRAQAPAALDAYFAFRLDYVDNRDFFKWDADTNGFRR